EIDLAVRIAHRRQDIDVIFLALGENDCRWHSVEQGKRLLIELEEHDGAWRSPHLERPRQEVVEVGERPSGDQHPLGMVTADSRVNPYTPLVLMYCGRDG